MTDSLEKRVERLEMTTTELSAVVREIKNDVAWIKTFVTSILVILVVNGMGVLYVAMRGGV